jgi:hypothetical protein
MYTLKRTLTDVVKSFQTFGGRTLEDQWMPEAIERFVDHLLLNKVQPLPCNIGDVFYQPYARRDCQGVCECKVSGLTVKADRSFKIRITRMSIVADYTVEELGKYFYKTKEEAEAKIPEEVARIEKLYSSIKNNGNLSVSE